MITDIPVGDVVKIKRHGEWEYAFVRRLPECYPLNFPNTGGLCLELAPNMPESMKKIAVPCKWGKGEKLLRSKVSH